MVDGFKSDRTYRKAHLISIEKTLSHIKKRIPSLEEMIINLPALKEDTITKKRLVILNENDKGQSFLPHLT